MVARQMKKPNHGQTVCLFQGVIRESMEHHPSSAGLLSLLPLGPFAVFVIAQTPWGGWDGNVLAVIAPKVQVSAQLAHSALSISGCSRLYCWGNAFKWGFGIIFGFYHINQGWDRHHFSPLHFWLSLFRNEWITLPDSSLVHSFAWLWPWLWAVSQHLPLSSPCAGKSLSCLPFGEVTCTCYGVLTFLLCH